MITQILMMNEKKGISVMKRRGFVQIESRSNDRSKWLTELIDPFRGLKEDRVN
jgi:hypothetical protein